MLGKRRLQILAVLLLFGAFGFGLVRLLQLRFATGDVFPPYSTLRADPLGTKIFYESLDALPDLSVTRNERTLDHLGGGEGTVLFLLGAKRLSLPEKEADALDLFVQSGGRLVLTLFPTFETSEKSATPTPSPSASPVDNATPTPAPTPRGVSLKTLLARWGVQMRTDRTQEDHLARKEAPLALERSLSWHSGISFHSTNSPWAVIYHCVRGPVMIEHAFGAGSIVLAADSYFLSNEALLAERSPELLAWLTGSGRKIIFDETHLNLRERPGVVTLLRRYGLGGFIAGFLLLVALWIWRNATAILSPPRPSARVDEIVSGRDSFGGFVHLLRRGIAPHQLLDVCHREWKKSAPDSTRTKPEIAAALTEEDQKNPVVAYNQISALLSSRKWKPTPRN